MKAFKKLKACKIFLYFFFLLGIIQPLYSLTRILLFGKLLDFEVYYQAAKVVLTGISPYLKGISPIPFNYPPAALFLLIPFSFLPFRYAQIVWTIFSATCLGSSLYLLSKSLNLKLRRQDWLLLVPLITLSFPVKWTFGMGQINHVVLLLLTASYFFYKKKQTFWSAFSLGVAISLKLSPIILLILFFRKRKWKMIGYTLVVVLLIFFFSGLIFGHSLTSIYFLKIMPLLFSGSGKEVYYNQSISGFVARLVTDNTLRFYGYFFLSLFLLGLTYRQLGRGKTLSALDFSLVIVIMLLINGLSWQHHFVWLIFPFLSALTFIKKLKKNSLPKILLILSYLLVVLNIKNPIFFKNYLFGPLILSHVFLGTLILFGLVYWGIIRE